MALTLGDNNNAGYIDHGDIALMNGAAALTVCCWRFADSVASPGECEKGSTSLLWMGNGRELHSSEVASWDRFTDVYQIPVTRWTHHACVFDGSLAAAARIKFFGDGTEQTTAGSTAGTTLLDSTGNPVRIARGNVAGVWAHLRIWAAALTEAEVFLEMHRYWAARQHNLLLDAPYDDALWARDYSGAGNHGIGIALPIALEEVSGSVSLESGPGAVLTEQPTGGPPRQTHGPPVSYGGKVLVLG